MFNAKTPQEQLALILLGDNKSSGNRTPRRSSLYTDSAVRKRRYPKSEDKKQKSIGG